MAGCSAPMRSRGLCSTHYQRWRRGTLAVDAERERRPSGLCAVEGCALPAARLGWCNKHHLRWVRFGDVLTTKYIRGSVEERLVGRRIVTPAGCWEYRGALTRDGYAHMTVGYRTRSVHRVAYETFVGPVPPGLQIDHLCCNKGCFRPTHLEAVPKEENIRRAFANGLVPRPRRSECIRGHALVPSNIYMGRDGKRRCVECRIQAQGVKHPRIQRDAAGVRTPLHRSECQRGHEFTPENTYVTPDGRWQCKTCRRLRGRGGTTEPGAAGRWR